MGAACQIWAQLDSTTPTAKYDWKYEGKKLILLHQVYWVTL